MTKVVRAATLAAGAAAVIAFTAGGAAAQTKPDAKQPKTAPAATDQKKTAPAGDQKKAAGPAADEIVVNVTYTGKGTVDATRNILVFLFDHPEPNAASRPLAVQAVTKNGAAATFKGVTAPTIYVVSLYDEKGGYDGRSGPPAAGTPIATYGKGGKPIAVKSGSKVTMSFNDANRFK